MTDALLDDEAQVLLLEIADRAIREALAGGEPSEPDLDTLPPRLAAPGASFVTLRRGEQLRGCIGSLEAIQPLARDVAHNAVWAAMADPRFPRVEADEYELISMKLSVLTPAEPFPIGDRADLVAKLRRGIDGLIITSGRHRATFLPSVWEQLPDVDDFLDNLWRKAGLPMQSWPRDLTVERYRTEEFG